jgi:hypothetical protein
VVKRWMVLLFLGMGMLLPGTAYAAGESVVLDGWIGGLLAALSLVLALGAYLWSRQRPG